MSSPPAVFGPGILIVQRTDITIPAPVNIGFVQELTIENAVTVKQLYGQKQYPLAVGAGTIKSTAKFKAATVSGLAWNAMMYGGSLSTGGIAWSVDSTYTIGNSTVATVNTLQIGSSTTFESDLGVRYSTSGLPLQRTSTGSLSAGQYSITTGSPGLYNFSLTDASKAIEVTYTSTSTGGQSLLVTNKNIGTTPTFQMDYYTNLNQPSSKPFVVRIYEAVMSKHGMPFRLEDFMIPEFEAEIFATAADQVYDFIFPEVS